MLDFIKKKIIRILEFFVTNKKIVLLACLIILIFAAFYLKKLNYFNTKYIVDSIQKFPVFAPILFIMIYAFMIVFLFPTFPMNLAAGFLWGGFWGSIFSIIAWSIGAIIAFLIGRYLTSNILQNKFQSDFWESLKKKIQQNDWKIIAFTRINPIFPFGMINYFYALTPISFRSYLWATILFGMPLSILFAVIGDLIGGFVVEGDTAHFIKNIFIISLIITILTILWFVFKKYSQIKNHNTQ